MTNAIRRRFASISAALLLASAGAAFRLIEEDSDGPISRSVAREIDEFPVEIGSWTGHVLPVDDRIIAASDTDAYLSRHYQSSGGAGIGLYVGCGVRVRDLVPHRPTVCYTGAGWTLSRERAYSLERDGIRILECRIYRFERGGLDNRAITVLSYYIIDGNIYPDVEYLRSRGWGRGNIGYVAQVQITSGEQLAAEAEASVIEFADAAASAIRNVVMETAAATSQSVPVE